MPTTVQIVTETLVRLSTLGFYAFAVWKTEGLLKHFINSRKGCPLFKTQRITKEQAIDTLRKHGIDVNDAKATA